MSNPKPSQIKVKWLAIAVVMTCLAVVVIAGVGNLKVYSEATAMQEDWNAFEIETLEKNVLLSELRNALGYGGMIHQFKNMVLRTDLPRNKKVEAAMARSRDVLQRLRQLPLSQDELNALAQIESVVSAYELNAKKVVGYIKDGKSATEIDSLVKISDKPALEGMVALTKAIEAELTEQRTHVNEDTSGLISLAFWGGVITVMVLLFLAATLAIVFSVLIKKLGGEPDDVLYIANQLAEGRLKVDGRYRNANPNSILGSLIKSVTHTCGVVEGIRSNARQVNVEADELALLNTELSRKNEEQVSGILETSSGMKQMTGSIKTAAESALRAKTLAARTREQAENGGSVVKQAVDAMQEINTSSHKIGEIINVIDEIAFQTNLLALNAAVEAARAGDQGRGFAVVAGEVRNLAQRSASAAREITGLIQDSVTKVADGSKLVDQSGAVLDEIVASAIEVNDLVADMSTTNQDQANGVDGVTTALQKMQTVVEENSQGVQKANELSQRMNGQAAELERSVMFFDLGDGMVASKPTASKNVTPHREIRRQPSAQSNVTSFPKQRTATPTRTSAPRTEAKTFSSEETADSSWSSF